MDTDLDSKSRDELVLEVKKLRAAIREHRDSSGSGALLAPPGVVVASARTNRSSSDRSRVAAVLARVHPLSPVSRRTAPGCARTDTPHRG